MYVPKHFEVTDLATLQSFIETWPFATLVTIEEGLPTANHVPLFLKREQGDFGTLYGHLARPNPQWRGLAASSPVLIIFHGPHAYISPSTYEHLPAVPTWNYAVVHAMGESRLLEEDELIQALGTLSEMFEPDMERAAAALPGPEAIRKMARGIVGFAVVITSLQGKFKLGQNRADVDRESAAAALLDRVRRVDEDENTDTALARMMLEAMRKSAG